MRILFIYSKNKQIEEYARAFCKGMEANGHQLKVKTTDERGELLTCTNFDLLVVGSPLLGAFGGKIADDVGQFLGGIKRTEGQQAIAFTNRGLFGTDKALRLLMGLMESKGCIVKDFRSFRSPKEAYEYGAQI